MDRREDPRLVRHPMPKLVYEDLTPEAKAELERVKQYSTAPTKGYGLDMTHIRVHTKYKLKEPPNGPT